MPYQKLLDHTKGMLRRLYLEPLPIHLLNTLSMMISGVFLGRNVQLHEIAAWVSTDILMSSLVRRFERFVADPLVIPGKIFKPFVLAMQACLGGETAYLIIDCTQAGGKCRTVMVALAYHGTVLPIVWKTVRGSKGHVKGEIQKALMQEAYQLFRLHKHVVVLGDSEYSNEQLIQWLLDVKWDFVLRFQSSYLLQSSPNGEWQSTRSLYEAAQVSRGQLCVWEQVSYTQSHHFSDLTVTAQWDEGETEMLCLVSNLSASLQPNIIYEKRYWIETLFGNHKSRGFQLSRTHLTDPEHIDRLILALAIATWMVLGFGTHLILIKQSHLIDRSNRRDLSLFQLGLRGIIRFLALNRLKEVKIAFDWAMKLPKAGFQPAT